MYKWFIYPILFGFYIPFSIYAQNSGEVESWELIVPFVIIAGLTLAFLTTIRLLRWNFHAFAVIVGLLWIVFFQVNDISKFANSHGIQARYLAPFLLLLLVLVAVVVVRLKRATILLVANMCFATSVLMYIYPLLLSVKGIASEFTLPASSSYVRTKAGAKGTKESTVKHEGDIYYIVLDGYGGNEVLSKYFKHDNALFYKMLEQRDFVISYNSRSNYYGTIWSLPSTLNMMYLDPLSEVFGEDFTSHAALKQYIYDSRVFKELKEHEYQIVMISSSSHLNPTKHRGWIDELFTYVKTRPYLLSVYSHTLFAAIYNANHFFFEFTVDKEPWIPESIEWVLNRGLDFADNKRKDFVFMHILSPHKPFYFEQNGDIAEENRYQSWEGYKGPFGAYRDAYVNNLLGLNRKVEAFLHELENSSNPMPIVILQADHGPPGLDDIVLEREGIDWKVFRFSILNAFLVPKPMRGSIQNRMTSVNTFRVILNQITGKNEEILENKFYRTHYDKPFQFHLVR